MPLFSRLGDAELAGLAGKFKESRHAAGDVIREEGAAERNLVVVADGTVELTLSGPIRAACARGLPPRATISATATSSTRARRFRR